MVATNRLFDKTNMAVADGQDAEAYQLNDLIDETNSGFEASALEMDELGEGTIKSREWADNDKGDLIDPTNYPTSYSSKANAQEANAWAAGVGGTDLLADGVSLLPRSAKEYQEDTAVNLGLTNADVGTTNADVVLTHADVLLTHEDLRLTNLDVVQTGADVVSSNYSSLLAEEWSDNDEDDDVVDNVGKYSSRHWAIKAETWANTIEQTQNIAYPTGWEGNLVATSKDTLFDVFVAMQADIDLNEVNRHLETVATGLSAVSIDASDEDTQNVMSVDRATQITVNNMNLGRTIVIAIYGVSAQTITWAGETIFWAGDAPPVAIAGWTLVTLTKVRASESLGSYSNNFVA